MKTRNVLTMLAFILAIGSAVASDLFLPSPAWTHKDDVSAQTANCEERSTCPGGPTPCSISFSIGDQQFNNVPAYDGSDLTGETTCGVRLGME